MEVVCLLFIALKVNSVLFKAVKSFTILEAFFNLYEKDIKRKVYKFI